MSDLIDRQKALNSPVTMVSEGLDWIPAYHIKDLPASQPERKTGRWTQISPAEIYECSECAQMVMTKDICCYKYCHGCGAYMGDEQDETD